MIRKGTAAPGPDFPHDCGENPCYEEFVFGPSTFSGGGGITRLRDLCAATVALIRLHHVREGAKNEWVVIAELVEETVLCQRLPDFSKKSLQLRKSFVFTVQFRLNSKANLFCTWIGPAASE